MFSCFTSIKLLKTEEYIIIQFDIKSDEIGRKRKRLQQRLRKLESEIGALLEIEQNTVNVFKPLGIANGLRIIARIHNNTYMSGNQIKTQQEHLASLMNANKKGILSTSIMNAWSLSNKVIITGILCTKEISKQRLKDTVHIQLSRKNLDIPRHQMIDSNSANRDESTNDIYRE